LLQRGFVEAVGATITGLVGGAVGFPQGVGHRLRPQLAVGVGIGDRPQIAQQMSFIPISG